MSGQIRDTKPKMEQIRENCEFFWDTSLRIWTVLEGLYYIHRCGLLLLTE